MDGIGHGAGQAQVAVALLQEQQAGIGGQVTASEICCDFATGKR